MATFGPLLDDGSQTIAAGNYTKANAGFYGINSAGLVPGAASGSGQFLFVVLTNAGNTSAVASSGGVQVYGVLQNAPNTGQACDVGIVGITKVVTGSGGITAGSPVMTDANGRAVVWTTGSGHPQSGWAITTSAANTVGTIFVLSGGPKVLT